MAHHLTPVSPALRVHVMEAGGQAHAALLLAVRWNEDEDRTDALVVTEHGGIDWVPHDRVEAGRLG